MRLLLAMIFLIGCGMEQTREYPPAPDKETPIEPEQKIEKPIVVLFGAPWCAPCKKLLPQVQSHLTPHLSKFDYVLYVTTGLRSSDLPTQEISDKYRDYLGLTAIAMPDPYWGVYRAIIGKQLSIPAAAVLYPDRKVYYSTRSINPSYLVNKALELSQSTIRDD